MKIGIITFNGAHNYGAQLQVFALQEYLKQQGYEVDVINYRIKEIAKSYRLIKHKKRKNIFKDKAVWVKEISKLLIIDNYKFKKRKRFESFIKNELNITLPYKTLKELQENISGYDILITGSDQVWNYNITKGIKPAYFLEFGDKYTTRISYAASLGVENVEDEYKKVYERYLKNLDFISVREESAKESLKDLTDKEITVVLDPTFLPNRDVYDKLLVKPNFKRKYIYMHMLVEDQLLIDLVSKLSEETGLPVVHNKPNKIFKNEMKHAITTGPKEFLGLISDAEYVMTNSFHATAFSIIYHKKFITVPHLKYPTRMKNLLDKLGLSNNLVDKFDGKIDFSLFDINYKGVDKNVADLKNKSKKFLATALVRVERKKTSYFECDDKFSCYGCNACKNACPVNAIEMIEDEEGFTYPKIDNKKCIKCGICKKTCIYTKNSLFNNIDNQECFSASSKNETVLLNSTSGGFFSGLAKNVIDNKGSVVGVKMDGYHAVYDIANNMEGCYKFRGAKYVRAYNNDIYLKVKKLLDSGKKVLFTGTPCCCAGLKSFLNKEYDNLLLVDIVCHSNASPLILEKYLKFLEEKESSNIKSISFRDKESGWRDSKVKIEFENGKILSESVYTNNYTANFLLGNISRPSCYNCEFSGQSRVTDLTIGDYWNSNSKENKGVSIILLNTKKGKDVFNKIKHDYLYQEVNQEDALKKNHKFPIMLSTKRQLFFNDFVLANKSINKLLRLYNSRKKKIKGKTKAKKYIRLGNVFPIFVRSKGKIYIYSLCIIKINKPGIKLDDVYFKIGDNKYKLKFYLGKGIPFIRKFKINFYKISIDISSILNKDIQNKINVGFDLDGTEYLSGVYYNVIYLKKGRGKNSKIWVDNTTNTSFYFRQSSKNTIYLTIREQKKSDNYLSKLKIILAKLCSYLYFKNDMILLFEKDSEKYEESASVLYEKLIDMGYKNVYFIFNKKNMKLYNVNPKYQSKLIQKGNFKHYLYFFKCKKFIGTESLSHSVELRIANKYISKKLHEEDIIFIFLQHGVMYMISLDADMRKHFNYTNKKMYKVVVSSELEAQHFVELGHFNREDLYLTGLPKYDKNVWDKAADKIVIMLTWRRWEYNAIRENFEQSNYYKLMLKIFNAVPENLKNKVVILPHPLLLNLIKNKEFALKKYIPENFVYDDILKRTKLLITDYSSISYDAFYRGSNIIFYWEEKDYCLLKYGKNAKLMLDEKLAFGDVFYNEKNLTTAILKNYEGKQKKIHQNRYKKIVEFSDNKNTERLIDFLIKDGILNERK